VASTQVVVRPDKELARPKLPGQRDVSIDYLRTALVLLVLADHSMLGYLSSAHFGWRNMILSDMTGWAPFAYGTYFIQVFCMPLMFFISGLFIYPALQRHGAAGFIRERFLRLGIPFAFSVAFLLPIAMYAPWRLTGHKPGFASFYIQLPARDLPIGPPWFLWELFFFDVVLVFALIPLRSWMPRFKRSMPELRNHPVAAFVALSLLTVIAYVPLIHIYGDGTWTDLFTWPFSFQVARTGVYALWFWLGFFVGAPGLAHGLIARNGKLARHWPGWILGCIIAFNALWFVPRWIAAHPLIVSHARGLAVLWGTSCAASCFGLLALFRGVSLPSWSWMKSLSRSAYVLYLVHYVFIAWSQYIVLNRRIHPVFKFLFVFLSTTFLSWVTAQALLRVPMLRRIL
jgi:glucans biosynthesis protein C